ncbi:hypothetical protein OF829_16795 [Sphingomonas sp. LB-2]|uniref:hypothetical protein n=1 Tax=Sphingomonas caeni TaxID=2984949 RepID=UPI00223259ED|nr:hypothetical protein [Sphingomonas caeni]MCW3848897.1 hypothetical protein [Sphingomonas caeni]
MHIISLGNAAAAHASSTFAPATPPEWILIALVLIGLAIGGALVSLLRSVRDRFPEPAIKNDKFVEGLLKGVRKQTERMEREFAELLRVPPVLPNNAIAYVRELRRLLRESTAFVAHMRAYPLPEWPSPDLAHAFADWAGVIDSMDSLLDDMFTEVSTAVERHSWVELFDQYKREEWYVRRDVARLAGLKAAIEKEAKPFQKKKPEPKPL